MPAGMCISIPSFNARCGVRYAIVSVPLVASLLEPGGRYFLPGETAPAPMVTVSRKARAWGPRLETLKRMALASRNRDEFARKLSARLSRRGPSREERAAIDRLLAAPSIDAPFA